MSEDEEDFDDIDEIDQKQQNNQEEIQDYSTNQTISVPYLPTAQSKEYTLVLDLDETLIHYEIDEELDEGYYLIRPGTFNFLKEISQIYEIVMFTAAIPEYANWIIDNIDPNKYINYRLYRQHTTNFNEFQLKDINRIGRPLQKTIIIDNIEENYLHTTPYNGIKVTSWYDQMDDIALTILASFLKQIVMYQIQDVRVVIMKYKNTIEKCIEDGILIPQNLLQS